MLDLSNVTEKEVMLYAGQLSKYIYDKNQSQNKNLSIVNELVNCSNWDLLQSKILNLLERYSHSLPINYSKFNQIVSFLMTYENNFKIKDFKQYFIAGFLSINNELYKKENGENEK